MIGNVQLFTKLGVVVLRKERHKAQGVSTLSPELLRVGSLRDFLERTAWEAQFPPTTQCLKRWTP